jgi:hypothetical protein
MRRILLSRALPSTAIAALLLAGTLTPSFAHGANSSKHARTMCVRGVQGACNPGLPGWGKGNQDHGKRWRCHPVMPAAPAGRPRSHAWMCSWVSVAHPSR